MVVTHSPTTFGVWRNEIHKHCPLPHRIVWTDGIYEYEEAQPNYEIEFWIVNIQSIYARDMATDRSWDPVPRSDIIAWGPEMLIVDEATCIGDPSALQSLMLYRLQKYLGLRYKLLLTGTPMHRKLDRAFGQFKIQNEDIFGTALGGYKMQFMVYGGYMDKTLLKYRNMGRWRKKVKPYVFQMRRVPHHPPTHQIIPVDLGPRTWAIYDDMEKDSLASVNGKSVMAPIILTKLLKCAQIAAGNLRDEDGEWHKIGNELRDAFEDHVRTLREGEVRRVVVYARHIPELRDAALALKAVGYRTLLLHGGVSPAKREQRIAEFHRPGGFKAFVAQVSTGSMGIDLSAADTTIYYTLTESLLHKDQADARTVIYGDTKRSLTYYYFLPRGTVLETMYLALKTKMDLVDFVLKHQDIIHHEETG